MGGDATRMDRCADGRRVAGDWRKEASAALSANTSATSSHATDKGEPRAQPSALRRRSLRPKLKPKPPKPAMLQAAGARAAQWSTTARPGGPAFQDKRSSLLRGRRTAFAPVTRGRAARLKSSSRRLRANDVLGAVDGLRSARGAPVVLVGKQQTSRLCGVSLKCCPLRNVSWQH